MSKEKVLGVLGGMGPQATNTFYQRIIERTDAETDQDHLKVIIYSDSSIPDRTESILSGDTDEVLRHLKADIRVLSSAGADVIAVPCNTSHYFYDELAEDSPVPIINMIQETVDVIRSTGKKRVGVLATDGTIRTGVYQRRLEMAGLTPVCPDEAVQKLIMEIIYDEIKRGGDGSPKVFSVVDRFFRESDCECAILGCTELSVYRVLHALPDFYIDAMEVLCEKAIIYCGKKLGSGKLNV